MEKWLDVATDPLRLATLALFLLFSAVARWGGGRGSNVVRWLFAGLAPISVIGGISLSFLQSQNKQEHAAAAPTSPAATVIQQSTSGPGSPTIAGVKGGVTINTEVHGDDEPNP